MELSSKLLSQCDDDTAQLTRLIKLLTQIRTDLNRRKMCLLQGNNFYKIINLVFEQTININKIVSY